MADNINNIIDLFNQYSEYKISNTTTILYSETKEKFIDNVAECLRKCNLPSLELNYVMKREEAIKGLFIYDPLNPGECYVVLNNVNIENDGSYEETKIIFHELSHAATIYKFPAEEQIYKNKELWFGYKFLLELLACINESICSDKMYGETEQTTETIKEDFEYYVHVINSEIDVKKHPNFTEIGAIFAEIILYHSSNMSMDNKLYESETDLDIKNRQLIIEAGNRIKLLTSKKQKLTLDDCISANSILFELKDSLFFV